MIYGLGVGGRVGVQYVYIYTGPGPQPQPLTLISYLIKINKGIFNKGFFLYIKIHLIYIHTHVKNSLINFDKG